MSAPIVLHRDAPWNPGKLPRGGRHRYAQVGDRRFYAEGGGAYTVQEVGDDGLPLGWEAAQTPGGLDKDLFAAVHDRTFVGLAFNLGGVRIAIERYLAGDTRAQIDAAVHAYGVPGTGRNAPANVAARRNRR